jgi:hypothetical protein
MPFDPTAPGAPPFPPAVWPFAQWQVGPIPGTVPDAAPPTIEGDEKPAPSAPATPFAPSAATRTTRSRFTLLDEATNAAMLGAPGEAPGAASNSMSATVAPVIRPVT